jgi:hypothetical protein
MDAIEMYVAEYLAFTGNTALMRVEALRYHL